MKKHLYIYKKFNLREASKNIFVLFQSKKADFFIKYIQLNVWKYYTIYGYTYEFPDYHFQSQ